MQYDDILLHIGVLGKYQKLLILALALTEIPTACQFVGQVFLAPRTSHWCTVPGSHAMNCSQLQLNSVTECQEEQKLKSIPYELDPEGNQVYSSCERYVMDDVDTDSSQDPNSTDVIPCDAGWDFDRSRYKSTINEDFSLVCDREDFPAIAQSVWFVGLLAGSLVWGTIGDWIGRRKTFITCLVLVSVTSTVTSFAPSFAAFTVLRFATAACSYGTYLMAFVIASELVGPKARVKVGTAINMFFSFGYMFLSGMAFLLREWRHLQLAGSIPYVLFFPLIIVLPESPRWLISKCKFKEATQILEKISRANGTKPPENLFDTSEGQDSSNKQKSRLPVTLLDLVRTPNIRKITVIMWLDWFVVNMVYYGLSLSTSALGIDDYLAALLSGAVEVPSLFLCWYAMERFGRRLTLSAFYVSGGLFCLITIFIPLGAARVAVAMLGKFAISAAFNHVYIYACELYPTVIRSMGVGASSTVARVSGILCPIILILGKYWEPLPLCVFGGSSVIVGIISLMLPETLGRNLPDTIAEGEKFGGQGIRLSYKGNLTGEDANHPPAPKDYIPLSTYDADSAAPVAV